MKTRQGTSTIAGLSLTGLALVAQNLHALPRSPLPPVPEVAPLYYEGFDEAYFSGDTNDVLSFPDFGVLEESWSGYALQRTGAEIAPFDVPALDPSGHTNISCDTGGAFRFWIKPYWSSQSQGGNGPGAIATALEFDAINSVGSALAWSLQITPDGNTLQLVAPSDAGLQTNLQTAISWQAGQSYLVRLNYGPDGTALYLGPTAVAQGSGMASIPLSTGVAVLGSTLDGTNTAQADIDEFYSFAGPLADDDVQAYYILTSSTAALGPLSDTAASGRSMEMASIRSPGSVYDAASEPGCSTGGPFYITNLLTTPQTNGLTAVSFEICGTNGVFYDIFRTGTWPPVQGNGLANVSPVPR